MWDLATLSHVAGSRKKAQLGLWRWWWKFVRVTVFIIVRKLGIEDCSPQEPKRRHGRRLPAFIKGEGKAQKVERDSAKL